jgi:gliding motility-associated-like protein
MYSQCCWFWPKFDSATRRAPIPFGNTVTFSHSNPVNFYGLFPYDTINPSNYFTPDPGIITFSPPNSTPHRLNDLGVFSIFPVMTGETGTISFSNITTTGFFLHVIQPLSRIDFDQPFTLISSDGDLIVGNSNGLSNNVLLPIGGPGDSKDDGNVTIFFAAGITQINYTLTALYSGDGFCFSFTFPDDCILKIVQNDTAVCASSNLSLSILFPESSILWSTGDTISTINVIPVQTALYYVTATCDGVTYNDSVIVTVNQPSSQLTSISICQEENFAGYTTSGIYIDTLVAANGCDSIRTLQLTVLPKPVPDLGSDKEICFGDSLILYPGQFNSYLWQNGSTQNRLTVKQPGFYSVIVINNCGIASDDILIKERICNIYFPTAFSPNKDGINDRFKILGAYNLTDYHLLVFNRWGQKVFETKDYTKGWDGSFNGQAQPSANFVWYCEFKKSGNVNKTAMKGTVVLIK